MKTVDDVLYCLSHLPEDIVSCVDLTKLFVPYPQFRVVCKETVFGEFIEGKSIGAVGVGFLGEASISDGDEAFVVHPKQVFKLPAGYYKITPLSPCGIQLGLVFRIPL